MRVLLADDQAWLRSALRLLIEEAEPEIEIVDEAVDAAALVALSASLHPDLVLLDWELPGLQGARRVRHVLADLRNHSPRLQIIVLSGRPESNRAALAAGANAFVSKADPPERLLAALHKVEQSINIPNAEPPAQKQSH